MEIDLLTKQQLAGLLAKPATVTQEHAEMLAQLVKIYPYYEPIHLLLAKADPDQKAHLTTAALYNGGGLVHQLLTDSESFTGKKATLVGFGAIKADENQQSEAFTPEEQTADEQETFDEIVEIEPILQQEDHADEQEVFDEITEVVPMPSEVPESLEEEIFEEIAEINPLNYPSATVEEQEILPSAAAQKISDAEILDELAIESSVAADFFAFEKSFVTEQQPVEQTSAPAAVAQPEEYSQEAEAQTVSKYDDDKLPFTFLWWLAKTRKEHEQIFQPYVSSKKNEQPQGELQQQYVEHIFHLQTPFNEANESEKEPVTSIIAHKSDEIIESFIKNEPQIRAPKAEQLNNENKAKKSAEDHNDLVSETLAAIYIEQMLYHKAIETYEKLSLKFPEKSRYFADLIQSLEKKI